MAKYIPKDAVLAEFDRLIAELTKGENTMFEQGRISALEDGKLFINSLEVKEVDLERELENWLGNRVGKWNGKECDNMCRYFFELGMQASNPLTWEDIDMLLKISPFVDEQHCDNNREFCKEVLKRFKKMKGE